MATVVVDDSSRLTAQVRWFSLRVGGHLALFYIHQMNRVNSHKAPLVTATSIIISSIQQNPEWRSSGAGLPCRLTCKTAVKRASSCLLGTVQTLHILLHNVPQSPTKTTSVLFHQPPSPPSHSISPKRYDPYT